MDYVEALRNHGIPPSLQRIKILEYLHKNRIHPTVDVIYKNLINDIPTLSKTTIYNTLKAFVDKGLITELSIFENESRYDINTHSHIHFRCDNCNQIYDLDFPSLFVEDQMIEGHKIREQHVYLKGTCAKCNPEGK
jgi:Fe2+ or Zn2+ uptake regulation protein